MTDTDIAALVKRLREYVDKIWSEELPPKEEHVAWQAADALEALQREVHDLTTALDIEWDSTVALARNDALEEAAKVAEDFAQRHNDGLADAIANTIRALAGDKP